MSLEFLAFATLLSALIAFWWHSDRIKLTTLQQINHICRQQQLQLLDQTMVLAGLWIVRSPTGAMALRRRYQFEFTSTGAARYRGMVVLIGRQIISLEMEPHLLPDEDEKLQ